jgi:hypothetical protein
MHSSSPITTFWAEYPALSLAAESGLKTRHAPSAPRMAHRVHHRAVIVRRDVRHVMRDAIRGKALPESSLWAAGARPVRIPVRAVALLLRKDATGLRALGLKPVSLLRTARASLPVPRSHRAPAGQGQKQNPRGGQRRNWLRALAKGISEDARPRSRARLAAYSLASLSHTQTASRARCALRRSTASVASGDAPSTIARWDSRLLPAVTGSVSAGALPSPCFAWGLRITALRPGGLHKLSLRRVKVFCQFLRSLADLRTPLRWGTRKRACLRKGCGRSPNQNQITEQSCTYRGIPNIPQSSTKHTTKPRIRS